MDIESLYRLFKQCGQVATDSRACPEGALFFALRGPSFDGNKYAAAALGNGCAYAVVDNAEYAVDDRYFVVDNALAALQELARHHRRELGTAIIGITGTNGKTTTKELAAAVLSRKLPVLYTEGNLNNAIGVPKTLLRLNTGHRVGVVEMGASHPGDIKELVDIAEPDCGIITNIGLAHLEGFGSLEGVAKTKGEMYGYLRGKMGAQVFVDASNGMLMGMSEGMDRILYGTQPGADVEGESIGGAEQLRMKWKRRGGEWHVVQTRLIGAYNLPNCLAAVAIGLRFGVEEEDICAALEEYTPGNGRSQLEITPSNRLIIDAYNANPTSMEAAIVNFKGIAAEGKMAILGDMMELGAESEAAHRRIAAMAEDPVLGEVWLVGPEFEKVGGGLRKFATTAEVEEELLRNKPHGRCILVKGSHGMGLDKIARLL